VSATDAGTRPGTAVPWHALPAEDVEASLHTDHHGLSEPEARARLERHGPNQLEEAPAPSPLVVLLRQFASPLIYILVAATVVTVLLEEYIDAGVIAAVLALNAVIGFTQERKAEGAVRALMQLVVPHARVVRGGHECEIDSRELVPGDVVLLESGTRVPADLRLVSATGLLIDESLLTGESRPVSKHTAAVAADAVLADRRSMAYTGAAVASGRGRGLVVATGAGTELGAIAGLMRDEAVTRTPLQDRMNSLARTIGVVVGIASVVTFGLGVALGGRPEEMFLTGVALAVAAIPEGLPVAFTITLALGVHRMARRRAIVRRLPAVETLGSTTVIGSDKTGTLTENRMTVQEIWVPGQRYRRVGEGDASTFVEDDEEGPGGGGTALHLTLLTGLLTNEASVFRSGDELRMQGDPTEAALLVAGIRGGLEPSELRDAYELFAEIPFESEHRYSASWRVHHRGEHYEFVKGAPERILAMCGSMATDDGPAPLDSAAVQAAATGLAADGLRVLAFAYRRVAAVAEPPEVMSEPSELVFVGLQAMRDPPRAGVREAIDGCRDAGIRVLMITGDHALTARAIADDLGISDGGGRVLTGAEIATMDDDALEAAVDEVTVYARVAPDDKLRIVRALQRRGEVVAVTGDGVNDAPALKAAAIGVAMGRGGTDVAREASDMVLADDNFVTITAAVEEGRVTFDNVRKVTFFLVSTGAAAIFAIFTGVGLGWPLIMLPAQLLWLNLVTNGLQDVALAFEPAERGVLRRPPRPRDEGVLTPLLWERAAVAGAVMATGTLALFRWELDRSGSLPAAQTVALTTMVVFMAFQAGNARSATRSIFRMNPVSNPFLFAATGAALAVHVGALYLRPTQVVLRVEPIGPEAWLRIVVVASTILLAMELHKLVRTPHRLRRRRLPATDTSTTRASAPSAATHGPARS
jgi:magnesium-transporting ATPase (P-type)